MEPAAYRAFLETLPDAAILIDGTTVALANARAATLLGHPPGGLDGADLATISPDPGPWPEGRRQAALRRGDGNALFVDVSVGATHGDGRSLALAVFRDDTDRRRIDNSRRTSEERLRAAVRVADLGIFDHDQIANTIDWSAEQRAIHGVDRHEPISLDLFGQLVHPDDREWVTASISRAHDPTADGLWNVEHRIVRPDGEVRWLLARSRTFFEGIGVARHPVRTIGAVVDITDQRAAAAALEMFRLSIDQASEMVFWITRDGAFDYVNEEACRTLGYTREELLGLRLWDVDPTSSPDVWRGRWESFERTLPRVVERFQAQHRRKDGTIFPVEVLAQHITVGDSTLHFAYTQDTTERQRLQEQLLQAQKMESVGRLAGGVAHDFNNLLTAIQGNLSLALLDLAPDDPIRSALDESMRASESAAKLTHQLLAFARHEVIRPQILDLNAAVSHLARMLSRLLGEDIDLRLELDPDVRPIRFDPGQLEQVLVNLAVNARDAMPDGGRLIVRTAHVLVDEATARDHPGLGPGGHELLAVTDDGTGMTDEVRSHLFEPFFTTKDVGQGTGLGLAMVYGAVTMNGGVVDVSSSPGAGATFRIYLPAADGTPEQVRVSPIDPLAVGVETILLVEDEDQVRNLAVQALSRQGYQVLAVANGDRALEILAASPAVDLLITDVVLPGMNGPALARRVRAIQPRVPVLYTSGYTRDVILHRGVLDDGADFLPKPYSVSQLVHRVREMLDGRPREDRGPTA